MSTASTQVSGDAQPCRTLATIASILPRRIIRFRELRRFSQTELACRSGVSRSQLNAIEGGQAGNLKVGTLELIAIALSVTPDALLGYDEGDLVRMPLAPGALAPSIRVFAQARICDACAADVPARTMHMQADCMVHLTSVRGLSIDHVAARFGLSSASVEAILRDEHESRRRRRW